MKVIQYHNQNTLRKKGTKAVTGAVPFQNTFVPKGCILVPSGYIFVQLLYQYAPFRYKNIHFLKGTAPVTAFVPFFLTENTQADVQEKGNKYKPLRVKYMRERER